MARWRVDIIGKKLQHLGTVEADNEREARGGPGCLNSFSASISGASAGVRLPCGGAAG